jgi:hypothetical protein
MFFFFSLSVSERRSEKECLYLKTRVKDNF